MRGRRKNNEVIRVGEYDCREKRKIKNNESSNYGRRYRNKIAEKEKDGKTRKEKKRIRKLCKASMIKRDSVLQRKFKEKLWTNAMEVQHPIVILIIIKDLKKLYLMDLHAKYVTSALLILTETSICF